MPHHAARQHGSAGVSVLRAMISRVVVATLPALLLAHIAPLSAPKRKRPVTGLFLWCYLNRLKSKELEISSLAL